MTAAVLIALSAWAALLLGSGVLWLVHDDAFAWCLACGRLT